MESKPYESLAKNGMHLPLEILAEIACIFPNNIWRFVCVCRQWRLAAILHPKCWSRIHLKHTSSFEVPNGMKSRLNLWVERSGGSQLELRLEGPFRPYLFSAPLAGCLSRIRTLHLTDWRQDFETSFRVFTFPSLEVLSVSTTQGEGVTLSRLSTAFLDNPGRFQGDTVVRSPRLRELALCGIFIDVTSLPRLPVLVRLKLSSCIVDMSLSLWDLFDQLRHSLEALSLWDVQRKYYSPPTLQALLWPKIDYPRLKYLTLKCSHASSVLLQDFISRIVSPNLIKLTCDDMFLPLLRAEYLPNLSYLYINSYQSSSYGAYEMVLKRFRIVSLTIYRDPRSRECGLNTLQLSMAQSPDLGKTLRCLRYLTTERVPQTILDLVNEKRRMDPSAAEEAVFASQILLAEHYIDKECLPWDTELWWTRK